MVGRNAEEFESIMEDSAQRFKEDTYFLRERGWKETDKKELNGEKVFSVWTHPVTGVEYGHQNSLFQSNNWSNAIDRAEYDLILEQGWDDFIIIIHYPNLPEKFQKRKEENDGNVRSYFIHPQTGQPYHYLEAVHMARFPAIPFKSLCGMTLDIQKMLEEQKVRPVQGMELHVNFSIPEGEEKHRYTFLRID